MMGGMGWWGSGMGGIFMILWWGLIIVGLVALVKWLLSVPQHNRPERDALDILKERYARGEIDREEYEATRRDLEQ